MSAGRVVVEQEWILSVKDFWSHVRSNGCERANSAKRFIGRWPVVVKYATPQSKPPFACVNWATNANCRANCVFPEELVLTISLSNGYSHALTTRRRFL